MTLYVKYLGFLFLLFLFLDQDFPITEKKILKVDLPGSVFKTFNYIKQKIHKIID